MAPTLEPKRKQKLKRQIDKSGGNGGVQVMALLTNSLLLLPQLLGPTQTQSPATFQFNHSWPYYHSCSATSPVSLWLNDEKRKFKTNASNADEQQVELKEEEEEFQVLTAIRSSYNEIVIVDTLQSRMLLLDSTRMFFISFILIITTHNFVLRLIMIFVPDNVHSILYKHQKWTNSYWVWLKFHTLLTSLRMAVV